MSKPQMTNTTSDPRQLDYFPPVEVNPATYGICVECGVCVASQYKDRHIAWHEEVK